MPDRGPPEITVRLRCGVTVEGHVVGPEGRVPAGPAAGPRPRRPAAGAGRLPRLVDASRRRGAIPWSSRGRVQPVRGGPLPAAGPGPGATSRVHLFDPQNRLGAVAEVRAGQAGRGPLESPRLRGLRRGDGAASRPARTRPLPDQRLELQVVLTPGPHPAEAAGGQPAADSLDVRSYDPEHYPEDLKTDARGVCTLPALIPGATYRLSSGGRYLDFRVGPGKVTHLPALVQPEAAAPAGPCRVGLRNPSPFSRCTRTGDSRCRSGEPTAPGV